MLKFGKLIRFKYFELALTQYNILKVTTYCTNSHRGERISWETAKPFSEIPSLTSLPLLGTAWHYMPLIGSYSLERQHLANKMKRELLGDVFREKFGPYEIILSFRPQDLEVIFRNEGKYPFRTEFSSIKAYRQLRRKWYNTDGLLGLNGTEWHELRSKVQKHILRPKSVVMYAPEMQTIAKDFVRRIQEKKSSENQVPELMQEIYKWTLESIGFVGLDTRLGCLHNDLSPDSDGIKMINSVLTQFECMSGLESFAGNIQFWKVFPSPTWKRYIKAADIYTEISFKYIDKAIKQLQNQKENDVVHLTFIQNLFHEGLTRSSIMVMVSDLVMAGIETTSNAAGFLLYHLCQNPEKQALLYEEITRLLPTNEDELTPEIYDKMRYAKACLKESLRLNPIVGGTIRSMKNDVVIGGYQVPAGTLVAIGFQEMCNDPKHIVSPDKFMPERWLEKSKKTHPFAVLPFGAGARGCIGKRIAELEIICFVTEIVRNYFLKYEGKEIDMLTKMVSMPDKPLKIQFIEREGNV